MTTEVLITGVGIVSPIGIGIDQVGKQLDARQSGIVPVAELANANWISPFGGIVDPFDPKEHVKPRKSLKVMSRETQLAFAAGDLAWANANLEEAELVPERVGITGAAGLQYCPVDELVAPVSASDNGHGTADLTRWGEAGMNQLSPLWLLKYLPNMAACHIGIRHDLRGPTNTIAHGETSSLLALGEACETIRRGAADVMIAGGSSSRIGLTHVLWRGTHSISKRFDNPAAACRPFDADRDGIVNAEGAAYFVLESREHAERRGVKQAWACVDKVISRYEPKLPNEPLTGQAIGQATQAVLDITGVSVNDLAMVKAQGNSQQASDAIEAQALQQVIGNTPTTAPTSYIGSSGSAGGSLELALALIAWKQGIVPATLNYDTPDPACPLNLSASHRTAKGSALLALNHNSSGQAVAALLRQA